MPDVSRIAGPAPDPAFDGPPDDVDVPNGDPDPEVVQLDMAKVRRYKQLRDTQAASEAEAAAIKTEADTLEEELIEDFSDAGVQNLNVDGKTVYLHRATFAQRAPGLTADDVKAALRASGHGDLVTETVNAQTLSAFVRELTDDDDAPGLPPELTDVLSLGERYSMRVIAGGSKAKRSKR